jgi:hypothetical protein
VKARRPKEAGINVGLPALENQFADALQLESVSASELARRVDAKRAGISRDLHGGLSRAKLPRIAELAEALDHDVVVLLAPRNPKRRAQWASAIRAHLRALR